MTRLALIADVHAHPFPAYATYDANGMSSRLVHCCDSLEWSAREAKAHDCDALVIAGDLFHNRKAVDVAALSCVSRAVQRMNQILPVVLLCGNHDLSVAGGGTSASIDALVGIVRVVREPVVVPVGSMKLLMLPWTTDNDAVRKLLRRKQYTAVIGHLGVDKAKVGPVDFEVPGAIPLKTLKKAKGPVFLGHYHMHRTLWTDPTVCYIGPLLQHTWGECEEIPGMVLLEANGSFSYVENPVAPRFVRRDMTTPEGRKHARKHPPRASDYVEVIVDSPKDIPKAWLSIRHLDVNDRGSGARTAPIRLEPRRGMSTRDLLSEYMERKPPPKGMDREVLLELGVSLIREGQE